MPSPGTTVLARRVAAVLLAGVTAVRVLGSASAASAAPAAPAADHDQAFTKTAILVDVLVGPDERHPVHRQG